ncbi:MAG: hypothetical protein GX495_13580 [Chloroflexi bacterium]|nr:hypothetical protein [Chloroflexota bacterium]
MALEINEFSNSEASLRPFAHEVDLSEQKLGTGSWRQSRGGMGIASLAPAASPPASS